MAIQSAYDGIVVTPAMLDTVLVCNTEHKWFRFTLWEDRFFIMGRRQEHRDYKSFDALYEETADDLNDLAYLYKTLFGHEPPNGAKKATLTKAIWGKYWYMAEDRSGVYSLSGSKKTPTGERERKRSMDGRRYRVLDGQTSSVHLQDQALVVHRELLKFQRLADKETISEAEVRSVMETAAKEKILKTKQDPFRIFQYYRGALIKANKLEQFE
jgi:hypothetical protein